MVVSVLLALVFSSMRPQALQTPDPNRIEDVQVRGNRRIPTDTIKFNLQTKTNDRFNMDVIRRDIKTLYAMQMFDDIRVEEEQGRTGKIIIFVVKEKPLVRSIKYEGLKSITTSEVLDKLREKKVGLSQESPFDPTRIKRAEGVIKSMLAEKGHQDATVETVTEPIPPNAVSVTFKVNEGPKIRIAKINIEGNQVFSDGKVKKAMKLIKESGPLTAFTSKDTYYDLKLADDITRIRILYAENGYVRANVLDPIIETKPKKVFRTLPFIRPPFPWGIPIPFWKKTLDRYYITIKIEENDQYKVGDVKITGSKELNENVIKAVLGLVPGQVYNDTLLHKGFESLKKVYGSRGYINFTPVPVFDDDDVKKVRNINISIDEDRQFFVNRIAFSGNTTTRDKVIRREVMVDEGQVFNSALWDVSIQRLNQLGYFEEIKTEDAEVKPHPTEPEVDINLKVKEKGRNSIGFNGGVSGIGGSFLGMSYETNNFLGFGETLAVSLQGGTRQSQYQFSFTEPYLFDRPLTTGFTVFSTNFRYDSAREVYGLDPSQLRGNSLFDNRINFEQKSAGFNLFGSYPFKIWNRFGLNFGVNNSETSAINDATKEYFQGVIVQEGQDFRKGSSISTFRSRKFTPSFSFNRTQGNPIFPTGGSSLSATFEYTGGVLGGNVAYFRPTVDYRYFHPMNRGRNILAVRFLGSYVQGFKGLSVPFYERFYLGGDFDIRGFDFRAISPIAVLTQNTATLDPETGNTVARPFDNFVQVGGDTQGVLNVEYRIPIVGRVFTVAPYFDAGNSWVIKKSQLTRQVLDSEGRTQIEQAKFLPGTNSGLRTSTGVELQVMMPVINAPFRLIFAFNPNRIDRTYFGAATGLPFGIQEKKRDFKFTVGRTF
ncbi:MAG: outer membrane protein assembly factor BamA [Acidobacteria bacterium]|nr:MAG: outer membrane protein assembly factor BamA [Acidobacteriota bacterium]